MSHTPGPWKVARRGRYEHDIQGPNREDIAYVNASDGADDPTVYPVVENARLIAAAPELLAALREVVTNGEWVGGTDWRISTAVYEMAAAAITTAEDV